MKSGVIEMPNGRNNDVTGQIQERLRVVCVYYAGRHDVSVSGGDAAATVVVPHTTW